MNEVIYEVNLEIQKEYAEEYMNWLRPHIMDMLEFSGFISCTINDFERVKEYNDPNITAKVITYRVRSRQDLQKYFDKQAAKMRGQGTNKFAGKFKAWRRVIAPKEKYEILAKSKL
eukprot:303833_1